MSDTTNSSISSSSCPSTAKNPSEAKPLKPCCACPETRKARDECILIRGDEEGCREYIEAHKSCLRSYGFQVQ